MESALRFHSRGRLSLVHACACRQKKALLKTKRAHKREAAEEAAEAERTADRSALGGAPPARNKLRTVLRREDDAKVQQGRQDATRPLVLQEAAVRGLLAEWPVALQPSVSMPLRPPWSYADTPAALEAREAAAFAGWQASLRQRFPEEGGLARYECNIEVWRQLWRTLEVSDALLLIVDARTPLLSFPQPLYEESLQRRLPCICLLNKADLLPTAVAEAWAAHLRVRFPYLAAVILFHADPGAPPKGFKGVRRRGYQRWRAGGEAVLRGVIALLSAIKVLPVARSNGASTFAEFWGEADELLVKSDDDSANDSEPETVPEARTPTLSEQLAVGDPSRGTLPYVTLGVVGEPNMGKSAVRSPHRPRTSAHGLRPLSSRPAGHQPPLPRASCQGVTHSWLHQAPANTLPATRRSAGGLPRANFPKVGRRRRHAAAVR